METMMRKKLAVMAALVAVIYLYTVTKKTPQENDDNTLYMTSYIFWLANACEPGTIDRQTLKFAEEVGKRLNGKDVLATMAEISVTVPDQPGACRDMGPVVNRLVAEELE